MKGVSWCFALLSTISSLLLSDFEQSSKSGRMNDFRTFAHLTLALNITQPANYAGMLTQC